MQEAVLALLAKEPSHGYELRARLRQALGPVGDAMNDGQIYVTLARLEKAGLVTCERAAGLADPRTIVGAQRRDLLHRLRDTQRAAMAEPDRSPGGLLLEGIALRLQADLRWLEACERYWTSRRDK